MIWNEWELMHHYANTEKYMDIDKWTLGYCMHSDWVICYFANFYNVSKHVTHSFYANVPQARMEAYQGSEIYKRATGFCNNERNCSEGSDICHRASADWMERETLLWRDKLPKKFNSGKLFN